MEPPGEEEVKLGKSRLNEKLLRAQEMTQATKVIGIIWGAGRDMGSGEMAKLIILLRRRSLRGSRDASSDRRYWDHSGHWRSHGSWEGCKPM